MSNVIRVLDLFCGGGGASYGYATPTVPITLDGIELPITVTVTGVDIRHQPAYPFQKTFYMTEALEFAGNYGHEFDFIHASPPCQAYSYSTGIATKATTPKLIDMTRSVLEGVGRPYVIENVLGAVPYLKNPVMLCGSMFGSKMPRHRYFEYSGFRLTEPRHRHCRGSVTRWAREQGMNPREVTVVGTGQGDKQLWMDLMGMHWPGLRMRDLAEAIPPSYTRYIMESFIPQFIVDQLSVVNPVDGR